jgi:hypothetical protein
LEVKAWQVIKPLMNRIIHEEIDYVCGRYSFLTAEFSAGFLDVRMPIIKLRA